MKKNTILITSIVIASTFLGVLESHAQSFMCDNNCFISWPNDPSFAKSRSSQSAITFVPANARTAGLTTFEKILNVPLGLLFGTFTGYLIGSSISSTDGEQRLVNRIKGGLIGAFAGPFVNYEILLAMKGEKYHTNSWYLRAGGNLIIPNHDDLVLKPGYSIGFSDYFPLSSFMALQADFIYQSRQFRLPDQKILYSMHGYKKIESQDINFWVGYFDMSLLLNFKLLTFRESTLNFAIGPSLAIELHNNTKYHFIREEDKLDDWDFSYIMMEPGSLFGYPALVLNLELQRKNWLWQLGFHHSVYDTDEIYPLDSNTRLRTFELSVGYKL